MENNKRDVLSIMAAILYDPSEYTDSSLWQESTCEFAISLYETMGEVLERKEKKDV